MAYVEKTSEPDEFGSKLFPVSLELEVDAYELLVVLMQRTGWDASELVGWALGAYWREMEGIVLPSVPEEKMEQVLASSEGDITAGRTSSNEVVFGRIAAKHGW